MKFGKLESLEGVDFSLPPSHKANEALAANWKKDGATAFYMGCPAWSCKEWVGKIYPSNAKDKDFLNHYGKQFNTIELNTTFYRTPEAKTVGRWAASVPEGFRFCPKFSKQITHFRRLNNVRQLTESFCETFLPLGEKLGTFFVQLPPNFSTNEFGKLEGFIKNFPLGYRVAIEFRHESWFETASTFQEVTDMLQSHGQVALITDVAGRRDVLHQRLTCEEVMIRFVGNNLHATDYRRAEAWVKRLQEWAQLGLKRVYFFLHEPDDVLCPELGKYMADQLNKHTDLQAKAPVFYPKDVQSSLF